MDEIELAEAVEELVDELNQPGGAVDCDNTLVLNGCHEPTIRELIKIYGDGNPRQTIEPDGEIPYNTVYEA